MTDKEIIHALKNNRYPFGMWALPICYGTELGEAMQAKAREIGKDTNQFQVFGEIWESANTGDFFTYNTYRLRSDYEEKPELRHGDYGRITSTVGDEDGIVIADGQHELDFYGDDRNSPFVKNMIHREVSVLGNIFDDLKAISEPLTEFEIMDARGDKLVVTINMSNELHFKIKPSGNFADNCLAFDSKAAKELILNLRRLQHTLRSKK